jgi:hypothetical protein
LLNNEETMVSGHTRTVITTAVAALLLFALGVTAVRVGSPGRVIVTWETASEVDTAAFHVYRSRSPEGPFSPITESPVPAEGDPLVGASYRYEDKDVTWGRRYFYQLEEVELDGTLNLYPEVVEGRAGVGWGWALTGGVALGALGAFLNRILAARGWQFDADGTRTA